MIEIREYNLSDALTYDQCLLSAPQNLIYPTRPFLAFLQEATGSEWHCHLAEEDGHVLGVFPYLVKRDERFGAVYNSLPWYGSYGGCSLAGNAGLEVRKALAAAWGDMLQNSTDFFTGTTVLSPFEDPHRNLYFAFQGDVTVDYRIGQVTPLPALGPDLDNRLIAIFSSKTRNLVRKSLKQSFSLIATDDEWAWAFLCETHHENMAAIGGNPKPRGHFDALRRHVPEGWRELLVAIIDDQPAAAMLVLFFNKTIEYITPAIKHGYRSQQPLSFLIWHGMLRGVERGFRWWNWGGTWHAQKSLHHFKAGWGAMDMPYSYLITAGDGALERLRRDTPAVQAAFPYFYLYPYHRL